MIKLRIHKDSVFNTINNNYVIELLKNIKNKYKEYIILNIKNIIKMVITIENERYNDKEYEEYFKEFSFELSDFQKHAIKNIVIGNHVFCNVPTGSGKTLPALFAISYFVLKKKRKIIYCSPIKSLSNQKYYEFKAKYKECSIGLITGDIKLNENADVIICTTEILMNYLLKNDDTKKYSPLELSIEDVSMIILDECHYIFDNERGYVWEMVIINMPKYIQLLLLSGSFKEPIRFCKWIEEIFKLTNSIDTLKEEKMNVDKCVCIIDKKRVVPLTHYSYLTMNEGFFKKIKDVTLNKELRDNMNVLNILQDSKGIFSDLTYNKIKNNLEQFELNGQYVNRKFILNKFIEFMRINDMLPAIIFVYSRKLCEKYAKEITTNVLEDDSKIPYTIKNEYRDFISKKIPNYEEYLNLVEYIELIKLLEKGIAYHHSGMLPILREMVEFAVNENKVKILFATESFGIGLNCAIKSTVFTQLKKHDGINERFLYSHEYLQMAGRAGRRGIDVKGYVIHLNNIFELPSLIEYKMILKNESQDMKSQYYISYNTVLNLDKKSNIISSLSILQYDINEKIKQQELILNDLDNKLKNKEKIIKMCRTPLDIVYKYNEFIDLKISNKLNNKSKKENDKNINTLKEIYYNIINDSISIISLNELKKKIEKEDTYYKYLQNYINEQINGIYNILIIENYIIKEKEEEKTLKWLIASNIHEIHPLIITDYIIDNVKKLSIEIIVGLLSLWCGIKLVEENMISKTEVILPFFVKEIINIYDKYIELENKYNIDHKTEINITSNYIGDIFQKWIYCNNENECKYFIQEILNKNNISLGDFTKGCLKIVAISKELEKILGSINDYIELSHSFSKIEKLLCKFIVTSQSLYIG